MPEKTVEIKEYRMSGANRRCAIYLIIGCVLALPCAYLTIHLKGGHFDEFVRALIVVPLVVTLLTYPLFWKIRVDENGLSRRRFWFWDYWWWVEFASGELKKVGRSQITDPRVRWNGRSIDLGCLGSEDQRAVFALINEQYVIPDVKIPDELQLKIGMVKRQHVTLNRHGVTLKQNKESQSFGWNEVSHVQITRFDELRHGFKVMRITLPDVELKLISNLPGNGPAWRLFRGATSEQVNVFVMSLVENNRITVDVYGQGDVLRNELEKRLEASLSSRRMLLVLTMVTPLLAAVALVLNGKPHLAAVAAGVVVLLMMVIQFVALNDERRLARELENREDKSGNQ